MTITLYYFSFNVNYQTNGVDIFYLNEVHFSF